MGAPTTFTSPGDGFRLGGYRAAPEDARRGGVVLIHEIFGLTGHIRSLADDFAADGYETLAPSLFDRFEEGFAGGHDAAGVEKGRRFSLSASWDQVALDLAGAIATLEPPVFVAGYCWGGSAAWLAACRCQGVAAVASYYGRRIAELIDESPRRPVTLHFGRWDPAIPPEAVEAIARAHPDVPIYLYDAGHGFASDREADRQPDAARLARLRTLQLFAMNGGGRGDF
ncbi:MAG TPA: dienelactone hydrolase family protein [Caulobacteraceae bacterium]